ncbi:MAG TPA: hypothetical protein VIF62_08605 [Labilithrix sp.]
MRTRTIVACAVAVGTAAAAVACLTEPPGTTYGNPNSLVTASIDGSTAGPTCGGGEGGGGGKTFEAGCPSFATDIFPTVANTWKCGDKNGCHGGNQAPPIDTTTAAKCLASLKAITLPENNQPYISADGGQMLCNLEGTCGQGMPLINGVGAKPPTDDELCTIQAWLKCGAPP